MASCTPTKSPALTVTGQAVTPIIGCQFVKIVAPRVGGGLTGGTSTTAVAPGVTANTLSTDISDAYQVGQCSVQGEPAFGVAGIDIAMPGQVGDIYKVGVGHILPILAGAAITAGQQVMSDAQGRAIPYAAPVTPAQGQPEPVVKALGYAVDSAPAGSNCEIVLY